MRDGQTGGNVNDKQERGEVRGRQSRFLFSWIWPYNTDEGRSMDTSRHGEERTCREYLVIRITPLRLEGTRWITVVPNGSRMPCRYLRQQPEEREQRWWHKEWLRSLVLVALNMSAYRTFKDCSQVLRIWLYWAFILSWFSPFSHISWLFLTEDSDPRASCWLLLCSHDQLPRFLHSNGPNQPTFPTWHFSDP